jgi:hypothetical protein
MLRAVVGFLTVYVATSSTATIVAAIGLLRLAAPQHGGELSLLDALAVAFGLALITSPTTLILGSVGWGVLGILGRTGWLPFGVAGASLGIGFTWTSSGGGLHYGDPYLWLTVTAGVAAALVFRGVYYDCDWSEPIVARGA